MTFIRSIFEQNLSFWHKDHFMIFRMRKYILIFIAFLMVDTAIGQLPPLDTIALYHKGSINYEKDKINRVKTYKGKTILHQVFHNDESLYKEYVRVNDSMYLYTEYYRIDLKRLIRSHGSNGKKREGLLLISRRTTGDTLTGFSAETFESFSYMDTILTPYGGWRYYGGYLKLKANGAFNQNGRHGNWSTRDQYGQTQTKYVFENNELVETLPLDILQHNSRDTTINYLIGNWRFSKTAAYDSNGYFLRGRRHPELHKIGETYILDKDGSLKINRYKYTDESKEGTWQLLDDELHFIFEDKTEKYKLQYLTTQQMTIKPTRYVLDN